MKFKIVKEKIKTPYTEKIIIKAVDKKGEKIFGAWCKIYRDKTSVDLSWGEWKIDWAATLEGTFEEKLPHFEVIRVGMEELKKRNEGKEVR